VLPDSLTTLNPFVFRDCTSLESIVIPDSITSIGIDALKNCSENLIIIATEDSYAVFYANENNIATREPEPDPVEPPPTDPDPDPDPDPTPNPNPQPAPATPSSVNPVIVVAVPQAVLDTVQPEPGPSASEPTPEPPSASAPEPEPGPESQASEPTRAIEANITPLEPPLGLGFTSVANTLLTILVGLAAIIVNFGGGFGFWRLYKRRIQ
jgi:hypothetical protein